LKRLAAQRLALYGMREQLQRVGNFMVVRLTQRERLALIMVVIFMLFLFLVLEQALLL
jgi:hypothetical protein